MVVQCLSFPLLETIISTKKVICIDEKEKKSNSIVDIAVWETNQSKTIGVRDKYEAIVYFSIAI